VTLRELVRLYLQLGAFTLLALNLFYGGFVIAIMRGYL
jgi:hypothetical protein